MKNGKKYCRTYEEKRNSEIFRVGQTYSFMGYDWTACELINKGKTLVIQSHGKGLFLINKEKASFTDWDEPGSGNYWKVLKRAAENAQSFGATSSSAWLGAVDGSYGAWCVDRFGHVYNINYQYVDYVVAPAFNLDLSKVDIVGDEIMIKAMSDTLEIQYFLKTHMPLLCKYRPAGEKAGKRKQRHNINQKLMKGKLKIIKIYQMRMEEILCMEIY